MPLQWIPLDALEAHPENSNRMPARLMEKLKCHIQRTGLYEPLVVRPLFRAATVRSRVCSHEAKRSACERTRGLTPAARTAESEIYQILNGHHRAAVLRDLGHTHARCDVWEVDDKEARVLLATLNRLEGRDDPAARARLVAHLAESASPEDLARLLPEPPDAVERLLRLAQPPPAPLDPDKVALPARPMTFFLTDEQHDLVSEALREIARKADPSSRDRKACPEQSRRVAGTSDSGRPRGAAPTKSKTPHLSRGDTLANLALWYLESRNLR